MSPSPAAPDPGRDVAPPFPAAAQRSDSTPGLDALWFAAGSAFRHRWYLFMAGLVSGLVAVGVTLTLPNEYLAVTRLLPPPSGGSLFGGLGRGLSSAARLLGDDRTGDFSRYLTILTARTTLDTAVDSFALVRAYETERERFPREAARGELESRADFYLDEEYEFLEVSVLDEDPVRAARLANFFTRELNRRVRALSSQSSGLQRDLLERRYRAANAALDSVLDASKEFQRRYGVFDLPAQTRAFFDQLGAARGEEARLRVQYDALRAQLGDENPQVQSLANAVASARRQYESAISGGERTLPIPQGAVPEAARQYAELQREIALQKSVIEVITPLYEAARLEADRDVPAVQIVDAAVPPGRKAAPGRTLIVLTVAAAATLTMFLLGLLRDLWRRHGAHLRTRLRAPQPA